MKLSIEKFKKYVDDEFSLEQLEALSDVIEDRLIMLKTAIDKANHKTIKGFSINEQADAEAFIYESLRDWFKKEKWVRISSSGNIAGPCGTSKNKKNPDRCLPRAKAQSLTKAQRAATARKKKKAGAKGKTVVKNTKAATVKKEEYKGKHQGANYKWPMSQATKDRKEADKKVTKEDIRNLVVGTIAEMQNENIINEKDDRCTRLAKQKYDTWPSAYASGAVVRCRRGEIWKKK